MAVNRSKYYLILFFTMFLLIFPNIGNFTQSNSVQENIAEIDENQVVINKIPETTNPGDSLEISAANGPYYIIWNESTLWGESSTSSWTPYYVIGSDYEYSWDGNRFIFTEEGADYTEYKEIDTGVRRTYDFRWDTIDINAKIEFDIGFILGSGGFEDSWCTWQVGNQDGTGYPSTNIDDVVEEGWIGGNSDYTVYHASSGGGIISNIQYTIPTMTLGGAQTFSIHTIGVVDEQDIMMSEEFDCRIDNIRIFDVQYRRSMSISELSGRGGDTFDIDGAGYQRYSTIEAVWLDDNRISGEYLIGDTYIPASREIPDNFGFELPANVMGSFDNITIETNYQNSTFDTSTGFPGFTADQGYKILSNDDFDIYASQGNGSSINPYILEDYNLNLHNFDANAITINNTDAHFILRDSIFSNTSSDYSGIFLSNVTNGVLVNNTVKDCYGDGIKLLDVNQCNLTANTVYNNGKSGIVLFDGTNNNLLQYNNISYNTIYGLEMNRDGTGCYDNQLFENLIEYNQEYGINTTGTSNDYYRNFIWLNTIGSYWDGGTAENWTENLIDDTGDYDGDSYLNRNEYYNNTDPFVADSDADGIPDGWEIDNLLDPLNGTDASDDFDFDSLTNLNEYLNLTDPNDPDTDDDNLTDYDEIVTHNTNPLIADSDTDGITDDEEVVLGSDGYITNALNNDTDGDNLDDLEETTIGSDGYLTDPTDSDTDGDNLSDGDEVNIHNSDPTDIDSDDDNLTDNVEVSQGTDPNDIDSDDDLLGDYEEIFDHNTNPLSSDTDNDTIDDFEETVVGTDGYVTDPTKADTDSDSITDPVEIAQGTDPTDADTDSDGLNDADEYTEGTNPNDSDSDNDTLLDGEEVNTYYTDPLDADSDSDGLTDDTEISIGSNPNLNDTDGDGLDDYTEVNITETDPTDSDSDDDTIDDYEEVNEGDDTYITDPNDSDTDGDGLFDQIEIVLGTDPTDTDSDNDTISDYEETILGSDGYITNPTNPDTDGDGIDDSTEIADGSDPTDPFDPNSSASLTSTTGLYGLTTFVLFIIGVSTLIINSRKVKR